MKKQTWVKFCGMTRHEDVAFACSLQVDAVGFIFAENSPRIITIHEATHLLQAVKKPTKAVAVVRDPSAALMHSLAKFAFDFYQFHGSESADFCRQWQKPYFKAFSIVELNKHLDRSTLYHDAIAFLIDNPKPGSGEIIDWSAWPKTYAKPLILAGGLNPQNVQAAIQILQPYGVDVASGIESKPGIKDHTAMNLFLAEVRAVETER